MIFVECNADKILVRSLGLRKKEIRHAYNKGNVCKKLEKSRNNKGLVDEDPGSVQPSYIDKLRLITIEDEIKVLYDSKTKNYLLVLCPRLEEWILDLTKELKVNLHKYNLPEDASNLHKTLNTRLDYFWNLISDIKNKSSKLKTLKRFLNLK